MKSPRSLFATLLSAVLACIAPAFATVSVASPANNATVSSPAAFVATASATTCAKGVAAMGIYVNNQLNYVVNGTSLNTTVTLAPGSYYTVVEEWDYCGGATTTPINLKVVNGADVLVSAPANGSTLASPVTFAATATTACAKGVAAMGVYVDNQLEYVVNATSLNASIAIAPGTHNTVVQEWDNCGGASTTPVNLTVSGASGAGVNLPTWHGDANRSGLNAAETILSPANVNSGSFGKLFSYLMDGYAYGQPLLMSNVAIGGATRRVVYAVTENDSVYAFDADSYGTGAPLWRTSLLRQGETPMTNGPIKPYQGVTSTPVIDPSTGTIYVVSVQVVSNQAPTFRLNALDIATGAQKYGGPVTIAASVAGTNSDSVNGVVSLTTACMQRAALLLANDRIYIGFGGCHSGWLLAYNAGTLAQTGVFDASPNSNGEGKYASAGGIWMGGGGPAADSSGNIYIATGNGPWDGQTAFGDSVLKFDYNLKLLDYFTPDSYAYMNCNDADLSAGGVLLIPGTSEVLAGGKTGKLYLANTNNLGKEQANDAGATQSLWFLSGIESSYGATCTDSSGAHSTDINSYELFGTAAYFNGSVYLGDTPTLNGSVAGLRQFSYSGTLTPGDYSAPAINMGSYGTTPFISANGTSNGVLWMIDHGNPLQSSQGAPTSAILRAYDPGNLQNQLYNSSMNSGDVPGYGIKFSSPIAGNGKVYLSTGHDLVNVPNPRGEIDVYGLK